MLLFGMLALLGSCQCQIQSEFLGLASDGVPIISVRDHLDTTKLDSCHGNHLDDGGYAYVAVTDHYPYIMECNNTRCGTRCGCRWGSVMDGSLVYNQVQGTSQAKAARQLIDYFLSFSAQFPRPMMRQFYPAPTQEARPGPVFKDTLDTPASVGADSVSGRTIAPSDAKKKEKKAAKKKKKEKQGNKISDKKSDKQNKDKEKQSGGGIPVLTKEQLKQKLSKYMKKKP